MDVNSILRFLLFFSIPKRRLNPYYSNILEDFYYNNKQCPYHCLIK
jgi:hypothetical protein